MKDTLGKTTQLRCDTTLYFIKFLLCFSVWRLGCLLTALKTSKYLFAYGDVFAYGEQRRIAFVEMKNTSALHRLISWVLCVIINVDISNCFPRHQREVERKHIGNTSSYLYHTWLYGHGKIASTPPNVSVCFALRSYIFRFDSFFGENYYCCSFISIRSYAFSISIRCGTIFVSVRACLLACVCVRLMIVWNENTHGKSSCMNDNDDVKILFFSGAITISFIPIVQRLVSFEFVRIWTHAGDGWRICVCERECECVHVISVWNLNSTNFHI